MWGRGNAFVFKLCKIAYLRITCCTCGNDYAVGYAADKTTDQGANMELCIESGKGSREGNKVLQKIQPASPSFGFFGGIYNFQPVSTDFSTDSFFLSNGSSQRNFYTGRICSAGSDTVRVEGVDEMNIAIAFFVGSLTFVLMMGIKIPIKKLTRAIARQIEENEETSYILYKRLNIVVIIVVMLVAVICYYFVLQWLGETHFKFCCALKAGAIAMALYAFYEQITGKETSTLR